ncbi:MAG TPA: tetratricopeptide repeat protein, partial [Ktedonobacterales bacterium]
ILATSRHPLHLPHGQERQLPVPPLGVPPGDHTDAKRVGRADAVQCFLQHAERHGAGFQLTDAEAASVAAICRHVGGIPLALELVSALLVSKRPNQLALELDGLLDLPNGAGERAAPHHRNRTLRKSLEWSVRRLTRPQRHFLTRLAIFSGGWTQRAAEEVCAGEGIAPAKVPGLLRELRDWSLISIEQMGTETRYTMLTLTQQYLRGRLASHEDYASLQRRHAEWCARWAEAEASQLETAAQVCALRRLDREWGNLRAALEWAITAEQPALALRLVAALWRYWWIRGWFGEGIALIQRTLGLCDPSLFAEHSVALHYARALAAQGIFLAEQGDCPPSARNGDSPAEARMRESLVLLRTLGDEHALAATLSLAGMVAYWADQYDAARFYLHESLKRRHRLGDRAGIADCQKNLGTLAYYQHRYGQAERRLTACLRTRRQLGDRVGMAYAQINLANVAFQCGRYETAEAYYLESLAWRWVLDARGGIASCLAGLFVNAADRGLPLRAAWLAGVETELKRALGTQLSPTDQRLCDERLEACRRRAGDPAAFAAAQARGAACPLDLAVACLLTAMDPAVDTAEAEHPFTALRVHLGQRLTVTQREIARHLTYGESLAPIQARRHIKKADFDAELTKIPAKVRAALEAYAEPPSGPGGSSREVSYS